MLKYADGEYRNDSEKNDYSEETVDAKMKSYWLFDCASAVVISYFAHLLLEILIKPDDIIRKYLVVRSICWLQSIYYSCI